MNELVFWILLLLFVLLLAFVPEFRGWVWLLRLLGLVG